MNAEEQRDLRLVKALDATRPGQISELYRRGDEFFRVSTVPDIGGYDLNPGQRALVSLGGILGAATSGEETMAFACDDEGNVSDWREVAVATGSGSRDEVLRQLRGDR